MVSAACRSAAIASGVGAPACRIVSGVAPSKFEALMTIRHFDENLDQALRITASAEGLTRFPEDGGD